MGSLAPWWEPQSRLKCFDSLNCRFGVLHLRGQLALSLIVFCAPCIGRPAQSHSLLLPSSPLKLGYLDLRYLLFLWLSNSRVEQVTAGHLACFALVNLVHLPLCTLTNRLFSIGFRGAFPNLGLIKDVQLCFDLYLEFRHLVLLWCYDHLSTILVAPTLVHRCAAAD